VCQNHLKQEAKAKLLSSIKYKRVRVLLLILALAHFEHLDSTGLIAEWGVENKTRLCHVYDGLQCR